jgi:hypothetical protein
MSVVAVIGIACSSGGSDVVETTVTTATTTPETATTTSEPPSTTTSTAPSTETTQPASLRREVDWFQPFTIETPPDWRPYEESRPNPTTFSFRAPAGRFIVFSAEGPDTVEEWIALLTAAPLVMTEPIPVALGSAEGLSVDVRLDTDTADQNCPPLGQCWPMLSAGDGWAIVPDYPNRIWVVDVAGETILILTESTEGGFADWADTVGQVLATIDWQTSA